jgi:hypothetical protein
MPPAYTGGGSSLSSLSGGAPRTLSCGGVVLLLVLFFVFRLLFSGSDVTSTPEAYSTPAQSAL